MTSLGGRVAVLGAGIGLLGVVLSSIPAVLHVEEALGLGWLFAARGPIEPPAEVAIVSLSRQSADEFGVRRDVDEWPRGRHGDLVDKLAAAGAAVIVFDIMFDEPRPNDPQGDLRFAASIERFGHVILAERVEEVLHPGAIGEARHPPVEPLRRAALATAPFMLPLVPVRVSQAWTFGRAADTPSLPSVALHAYAASVHERLLAMLAGARPELRPKLPALGLAAARAQGLQEAMRGLRRIFRADPSLARDLRAALEAAGGDPLLRALIELYAGGDSVYLNYYGPPRTIETISYHDVLGADPAKLADVVSGRVVFVGFAETRRAEQQDEFVAVFTDRSGQRLPGVEIGATAFANLLHVDWIRPLPLSLHFAVVAAFGILVAAVSLVLRGFAAVAAGLLVAILFAGAARYVFVAHSAWGPLAVPLGVQLPIALLVGLSWSHGILRKQRERIRSALGYYVPPDVVARLAKESLKPRASRELVFGTVLVTDAEQYTTLSESLHPTELGDLMDAYYEALVDAVGRHGGVVSDIGGDSMIAVWPAATSVAATRLAATRGALEVLAAVDAFNHARMRRVLPTRIGIDSGQLLLGNVGASVRGEYRAVGDIVNTASRLQGLNRLLGTRVLVSAGAAEGVGDFAYRPLGEFLLVGKRTPVAVLELRAPAGDVDGSMRELDAMFASALARFRAGEFRGAHDAFRAILARFPGDGPSRFLAAQCRVLAERQPDGEWDGAVRVTVK